MDKTQQTARETAHKRMRQQTEKLSTEIRQSYKSTFRTLTEVSDTSSKRYVLANTTPDLINYELRRKMRQVGVQVQDIGSYLCWETFVDEPGTELGLADLVHVAAPADLLPVPDQTEAQYPADRVVSFQTNAVWNFGDARQHGFVPLTVVDPPPAPEGFEVVREPGPVGLLQISGSGEDFTGTWAFEGRFTAAGQLAVGVVTAPGGLEWDERFVAPDWWKPRERAKQFLSLHDLQSKLDDSIVFPGRTAGPAPTTTWSPRSRRRPRSGARSGGCCRSTATTCATRSSTRPGSRRSSPCVPAEEAAMNWLQNAMVEGADGLDAEYAAPADELDRIRTGLGLQAASTVTLRQAIDFLCLEVAEKHAEANRTKTFPDMDLEAGDPYQPDHLILCDAPPPPPGLGRLYRNCACGPSPLGVAVRSYDNQWNIAIDPDGS
jgi:hypothetical protein